MNGERASKTPGRRWRWRRQKWGYAFIWGFRHGEWWIGARRNFAMDAIEVNAFGLTLIVGRG